MDGGSAGVQQLLDEGTHNCAVDEQGSSEWADLAEWAANGTTEKNWREEGRRVPVLTIEKRAMTVISFDDFLKSQLCNLRGEPGKEEESSTPQISFTFAFLQGFWQVVWNNKIRILLFVFPLMLIL